MRFHIVSSFKTCSKRCNILKEYNVLKKNSIFKIASVPLLTCVCVYKQNIRKGDLKYENKIA